MIKTLKTKMTFTEALTNLIEGKCVGIRPSENTQYIVLTPSGTITWISGEQVHARRMIEEYSLVVETLTDAEKLVKIQRIVDSGGSLMSVASVLKQ